MAIKNRSKWSLLGNAIGFGDLVWYPCDEYDDSDLGFATHGPHSMQQCLWL